MKSSYLLLVCLLGGSLPACKTDNGGDGVDAAAEIDAPPVEGPDGTGCTDLTPRTTPLESFVGPTGLEARMGALIDGAQSTLDIHMYLWNVKPLATKVVDAKNRGVKIRVILDPDEAGNQAVTPTFTSGGIAWKNASPLFTYAHAKYLIVDGTQTAIMSMNFNSDAMVNERNYGVIDRDAEDIADVQRIFEYDWAVANGKTGVTPANLTCTRLIVSPTNSAQRLLAHINSATTNLDVEVLYVTDTGVRAAILNAKQRGVAVRVIFSDSSDASIPSFKAAGIPVKTPSSFFVHAKLIIADQVAFVGSENMSYTSLSKNREVGVLAFEPEAFAPIKTQFESDWTASTPVP